MSRLRPRPLGALLTIAFAIALAFPPPGAWALTATARGDGFVVIEIPVVERVHELWIDVEAPGIGSGDVVVRIDGSDVALRTTPFGAGAIVPADGGATELLVGVRHDATVDIAIQLTDADGRILLTDGARLAMTGIDESTSPPPSPDVTPEPSPTVTPSRVPSPGLPSTGVRA
jgi:hypothetical protein